MADCAAIVAATETDDPRIRPEHIRCIPAEGARGSLLLIGVVHDHPASTFRVTYLLERFQPTVLVLELPPLAMPLFRQYAADVHTPPRLGGEMSMAIKAAGPARTVGIDAPNWTYLGILVDRVRSSRVGKALLQKVLADLVSATIHAAACRLGAVVGRLSRLRLRIYSHIVYDCTLLDSPSEQADHEASHLAQQRAFLRAIEIPRARQFIDETREASMARQLLTLRADGDVVAVVGMEHLDPLYARLPGTP